MCQKMSKPNLTPLEKDEAVTAMQYLQARNLMFTHVKNEIGFGDERELKDGRVIRNFQAMRDYQLGVAKGFPDFVIVLPYVGLLIIELKRQKGNAVTPEQQAWIDALNTIPGVQAACCKGAAALIDLVEYLYPIAAQRRKIKA